MNEYRAAMIEDISRANIARLYARNMTAEEIEEQIGKYIKSGKNSYDCNTLRLAKTFLDQAKGDLNHPSLQRINPDEATNPDRHIPPSTYGWEIVIDDPLM